MARFKTTGLDQTIQQMKEMGELVGDTADEMLQAGAEEVKKAWRKAAVQHGLVDTGDMYDSIGFAKKPKNINGIKTMDIYPQGKDRRGVRNVEKAFYNHYGSSKGKSERKATHWVDTADELAEDPAVEAMNKIWDEALRKRGL